MEPFELDKNTTICLRNILMVQRSPRDRLPALYVFFGKSLSDSIYREYGTETERDEIYSKLVERLKERT